MQRLGKDFLLRPLLYRMAQVHHQHVVRDMPHHGQIVRDKEVSEPQFVLQIRQQIQNLCLNRHVERRNGLVGHHQLRAEHEGAGDGNALALAAGEHVRVALGKFRAQAHTLEHGAGALTSLRFAQCRIDGQRRLQRGANFLAWIERTKRVLEHQLHGFAQGLAFVIGAVRDVGPTDAQLAAARVLDQRNHARQGGLAAARLAHHGQGLPCVHVKRHAAHRLQLCRRLEHATADGVDLLEPAGLDNGFARVHATVSGTHTPSALRRASRAGSPNG